MLAKSTEIKSWAEGEDKTLRSAPTDGLVEKRLVEAGTGTKVWVPVAPEGMIGHLTWRRWVSRQVHVGLFGGHRLGPQTLRILSRVAWWPKVAKQIEEWISRCGATSGFGSVPPCKILSSQEIMVDFEGPSSPADRAGNTYVLTYVCCLSHAVLFEPTSALSPSEVRRAFSKCMDSWRRPRKISRRRVRQQSSRKDLWIRDRRRKPRRRSPIEEIKRNLRGDSWRRSRSAF